MDRQGEAKLGQARTAAAAAAWAKVRAIARAIARAITRAIAWEIARGGVKRLLPPPRWHLDAFGAHDSHAAYVLVDEELTNIYS